VDSRVIQPLATVIIAWNAAPAQFFGSGDGVSFTMHG
jgi:hypothetical protein